MKAGLLNIAEAANILRVSTKTLRRYDEAGILVPQRSVGNQRQYSREQVDAFLASRDQNFNQQSASFLSPLPHTNSAFQFAPSGRTSSYQELSEVKPTSHGLGIFPKKQAVRKTNILNSSRSAMRIDALTTFFLVVILSSIFLAFASLNYFREKKMSATKAPQAQLADASFKKVTADLGVLKHIIVNGITELNGEVFINGEKLNISKLGQASENTIAGVASLQGETGDLTLTAGYGITIDGLTISATGVPGATGSKGDKGDKGDPGSQGATGSAPATGWQLVGSNVSLTDNSYNVGIGTNTPTAKLDVLGTASISGALKLYGTPTIQSTAKQTLTIGGDTTGHISFAPGNSTNTLYLRTGGNVGLGTAVPGSRLQVNGSTALGYSVSTAGPTNGLAVSGSVGIGTTTPGVTLDVLGAIRTNNNLYVNGGTSNFTSLNDVINVNKTLSANATSSWSTGTAGGTARSTHTSVLYNGKMYSWGGWDTNSAVLNTVDIYDIAAASWSTGTAGGTARRLHSSVLYNGKIYSWGGENSGGTRINTVDIYDIAAGSWSTGTAGGTARSYHTSILYNGKIYSWGGYNGAGSVINTVDIYDIANNSWSTGTAGGTPRSDHKSVLYNGKIYSWGGANSGGTPINTVDIYDIANNSWSTGTAGGTPRSDHVSILYNGKIYSWGGWDNSTPVINTVDIYDIAAGSWSTGVTGGTARYLHTAVFYNGKMYSWGGADSSITVINTVDIYDVGFKQTILALQENGQDALTFQTGSQLFLSSGILGIMGGNVGIGTATPSAFKLQVAGNIGPDSAPTGGINTLTTVDSATSASTGEYTSIYCVTSTDCKIAYYDVSNQNLMMADCDDATCSTKTLTTVDSVTSAKTGEYASIYCLSSTDCKIAYMDGTNFNLMMADCDDATCSTKTLTTVDATDVTGITTSIYCVTSTDCKIAYREATADPNQTLLMADCDDATCATKTITVVDSSTNTGLYTSIYCVTSTDCKISYQNSASADLMMADCDNSTCSTKTLTTVDSATNTGYSTSIYCISTTDCKISYQESTGSNLMMADCDDATCATKALTIVDNDTNVSTGLDTSIYCLSTTDCKISHFGGVTTNLVMADCDDATCATKTLTTVDSVTSATTGQYNSIYCLSTTDCKISYLDGTNTNLMMADCNDATCATSFTGGYNVGSSSAYFNSVYAANYYGKSQTISSFDLAETYAVLDQSISAGDLVTTEAGSGSATVAKSQSSYQSSLVGIVSTKPGITLSEWEDVNGVDKRPVALAGRVPTKVNDENGPIAVGDYITSSSTPGVGMKATRAGRVVGVALEPYNGEGEGKIEVFVNSTYFIGLTFAQDVSEDPLFSLLDTTGVLNAQYSKQILSSEQTQKLIQEQAKVLGISAEQTSSISAQLDSLSTRLDLFQQNLSSQQTTIASISATLASLPIINLTQFATGGAILGITTVDEDFAVFGNTTLNNLNTIGNITIANNLTFSSNSINTIGEDLQIQPLKQANVSFMNGLVTIDTQGNITIVGSIRADSITLTDNKTVGSAIIPAGQNSINISTSSLTASSKILLSPTTSLNGRDLFISDKQEGVGFTVQFDGETFTTDLKFDWLIIATQP